MPTQVKLGQMVDLALGTPEVGAVNFNVLHTLLHAMLKKLNMNDAQAEISEFDRDFLSSSKQRQVSGLSDLDSGRGDDSEDAMSEKSTSAGPGSRKTPYHHLELKVAKITEQLENFSELPSYKDLFERLKYDKAANTPVADMWKYINIQKDVEKNSAGVDELMKLVQKLMQDIQRLEDENKKMMDKINGLNINDMMKKLKELEDKMTEMNEKFNQLPTMPSEEEWSQFVTWPGLEDALNGVKKDWADLQQPERVVIEMSSQTEPPSRPVSSRASTRMSSPGPSAELLDILERLGKLSEGHLALTKRVDAIEEELKNKLDKNALENLNLSSDLLEQLGQLRADLDALAEAREKTDGKASVVDLLKAKTSSQLLDEFHKQELQSIAMDSLVHKVSALEDKFRLFQDMVMDDSAYQSQVSDLTAWLEAQKNRPDPLAGIYSDSDSPMESESRATPKVEKESDEANKDDTEKAGETSDESPVVKPDKEKETDKKEAQESSADGKTDAKKEEPKGSTDSKDEKVKEESSDRPVSPRTGAIKRESFKLDEAIVKIFESEYKPDLEEVAEIQDELGNDLSQANDRIKTLALILNNQLHTIRDKIFALDNDLKRMAKGVEFALLRAKVAGMSDLDLSSNSKNVEEVRSNYVDQNTKENVDNNLTSTQNENTNDLSNNSGDDSDALSRAQQAILQLQAEVEKLHGTTKDIIEENERRSDQIDSLFKYCDKLQEVKADKEYVQMEVDVKADKRSLDNKVNHTLFDSTTNEINKMIKEILDKLAGNEESWKNTIKKFAEDIDGKLDRLELDPLKEWLESRLKALNDKLRKQQAQVEWTEDDAAGIRKQLIQRFHCISCDRPVDLVPTGPVPALPTHSGLPPTRSPRPYTTFELDQIRQHAKSGPRNNVNFERAIAERQLARMRKSDLKAFLVHFGRDLEAFRQQREEAAIFANAEVSDYYATPRPCGGSHTMTYPHKRITRLSHLSHLFREEDGNIYPLYKEEVDVQGADGHIYKGRMGAKLEARLPVVTQAMERSRSPVTTSIRKTTVSPPPGHRVVHHPHARPSSARAPPPRASGRTESPRPQSAHPQGSREGTPRPDESSHMIPAPPESPVSPEKSLTDQARIEVPIPGES